MKNLTNKTVKYIRLYLFMMATCLGLLSTATAQDSKGTEFWICFPGNLSVGPTSLFIASEQAAVVTVDIPGLGFNQVVNVPAGGLQTVNLNSNVQVVSEYIADNKGIHITSDKEVTVYGMNAQNATTDAFLAFPLDAIGQDYYVMGYNKDFSNSIPTQATVVGTQDNTTITITSTMTGGPFTAGVPANIVLQKGQVYQLRSISNNADYTGTKIVSDKPISVFGGAACTNISGNLRACDHLVEQLPALNTWGKSFLTVPLSTRLAGDVFRFMAQTNGTEVKVNGVVVANLNAGQFFETILGSATFNRVTSNLPILVGQFSRSSEADGVTSDPFFALVPPDEQFLGTYVVSAGTSNIPINFINITSPTANTGTVKVDGIVVGAGLWTPIPGTIFSGAKVPVANGVHSVTSTLPIGVLVYGFGSFDSYGYLGGQSFSAVASVTTLTLTPKTGNALVGTNRCWDALVVDQNGNPLSGIRVDFEVTGVNVGNSGFAFTNASGIATYCYTGVNEGDDAIDARVGSIFDNATFTWNTEGGNTCIDCNGNTILVNSNVIVDFNKTPPLYSGDLDLKPFFTADKSGGSTPDKWKAVFNVGANKLVIQSGVTITTTRVPNTTSSQSAPGISIISDCELEVQTGARILVNAGNKNSGDITIQVKGNILIDGEVRNEVNGTLGLPGAITINSKCGDLTIGNKGIVFDIGIDPGGNTITLATCGEGSTEGNITVSGLVMSRAAAHTGNLTLNRPNIIVASANGSVTINANTAEPMFDEYNFHGTLWDLYGGLLSWVTTNSHPGKVEVQAKNNVSVNGHGVDPTGAVRKSFGAIAAVATASDAPGGIVDVRSIEGSIIGNNRSFDVSGRNRLAINHARIRLYSMLDITLTRSGLSNTFNPVVDASSPSVGDKGGINDLRSYSGGISLGANVIVSAAVPAGNGSVNGVNLLSACTNVTGTGIAVPADLIPGDNSGTCAPAAPTALFTDCNALGGNFRMQADADASTDLSSLGLIIYPNPAEGKVSVQFNSAAAEKYTVSVVDVTGRMMINDIIVANEGRNNYEIDLTNAAKGVYILTLENASMKQQVKLSLK